MNENQSTTKREWLRARGNIAREEVFKLGNTENCCAYNRACVYDYTYMYDTLNSAQNGGFFQVKGPPGAKQPANVEI